MNNVQQIGRLTSDPEPLHTTDHGPVTTFRLAVPRRKGGEKEADFFTVEVWQRLAETCSQYLRRGREVAIEGRLDQREWRAEGDRARERVVIVARSVQFLRSPSSNGSSPALNSGDEEPIPF